MKKKKEVEVEVSLSKEEAREVTRALDQRLHELDGMFKACIKLECKDAAEGVARTVKLVRELRERIDGSKTESPSNDGN